MISITITGIDDLIAELESIDQQLGDTVRAELVALQSTLAGAVSGTPLPGMGKTTINEPELAKAIMDPKAIEYPVDGDLLHGRLVISSPEAIAAIERLERGAPSRDMKPALLNSPKAKVSKNNTRYIDVPIVRGGNVLKQGGMLKPDFRRVSSKSSPSSWMYPGAKANPIMAAMEHYAENSFITALEGTLARLKNV